MAKKSDLMGLGLGPFLSNVLAKDSFNTVVTGTSNGTSTQIGGTQYLVAVTATNGGNYLGLPTVNSLNNCLVGDEFVITNLSTSSVIITQSGTGVIIASGASINATTGVSVASLATALVYVLSASTLSVVKSA